MSSRHHIDDFMRGRIIGKIEEGRKITDVARVFDIAHSVVLMLWKSFKTTGMCSRRHGEVVLEQVANQFLAASGKQISRKTVARRLRGGGLYTRRPVVCVPLTRQHRTACLQWCREHHNWTEQDWACVLFSDESRFSLSSDCRRQLIWRESGTAYRPENIQEKDRYPTCSIMVGASILINGHTRLHVVANGTMTGQRYIDEVLPPHVRLFRGTVSDKFVFMDDNATYLNPIENVWDALGRQVAGRNYPPTNKNTLIRALTEEWDKLPQQLLDNVVQMLCEGETRNRWRDGQVCPDVGQGTMAPWARRLGCVLECYAQIGRGRREKNRERTDGRRRERRRKKEKKESRGERERSPPCMEKRAESGIGVKKTMNADLGLCALVHHGVSVKRERKDVLLEVAKELRVEIEITLPKIEFKKRICQSKYYYEESVKCLFEGILEEKREESEKQEIKEFEERRLVRELELERMRVQLRNKLNENKLKAGNRINDLANVCILSENRTTEVSEPVNKCRPLINPVVNTSVENATSCDFEKKNCDPSRDKGVANPEGLICENSREEKYTLGTLMGCEKQLTVDQESFRNHTMAKIAGQLNGEKENICKADVRKGLEDGLAMRLPLSEPREIYKDNLETDNRSNIGSEFTFEIDFTRKKRSQYHLSS
ncbi:transposable element Tcb1 transposase [Trichonephila clavipes]|nr:transposable element Tcb1 transposase [Trichonephila clavipes]